MENLQQQKILPPPTYVDRVKFPSFFLLRSPQSVGDFHFFLGPTRFLFVSVSFYSSDVI